MKSRFLASMCCLSVWEVSKVRISLTQSSSFLMALAISLIVSRKTALWLISSGIRDKIFLRAKHFLFSSWNGSSGLRILWSSNSGFKAWSLNRDSVMLRLDVPSVFLAMDKTKSRRSPGLDCSAYQS